MKGAPSAAPRLRAQQGPQVAQEGPAAPRELVVRPDAPLAPLEATQPALDLLESDPQASPFSAQLAKLRHLMTSGGVYAGIGSRETPPDTLRLMEVLGGVLARSGCTLRSGAAPGADSAFEKGARAVDAAALEIFLPWKGFEGRTPETGAVLAPKEAFERAAVLANEFHPRFPYLSRGAKALQSRNSFQVLGLDLETPADLVVCFTTGGRGAGGTGQAIRIASAKGIPVLDLGAPGAQVAVEALL